MVDARRIGHRAGLAGPLVGFGATMAAIALSPTFDWTESALSDLGAAGASIPWLFNGGLVVSAVVTLPFAWVLWSAADHPLTRLGAVAFAGSIAALGLVGAFPAGTDLHLPVAVAYFALLTVTTWVHGTGSALAGVVRRGLAAIWLGIGHVLVWILWIAAGPEGIAAPELLGSLLLYAWILLVRRDV